MKISRSTSQLGTARAKYFLLTQNLSESERNYLASLKNKCKTVDENNSLLQKRISWLREEVEMHLERQAQFEKDKVTLMKQLKDKEAIIKSREHSHHL